MGRLLLALVVCSAPAFAREVSGRVSQTGAGSEAVRKRAGGQAVLRVELLTQAGEAIVLHLEEGRTRVFEGERPATTSAVRPGARLKAVIDDGCAQQGGACIASRVEIEKTPSITRIEAFKERDRMAQAEVDKGLRVVASPAASAAAPADCPDGMLPWIKDGQRVEVDGKPACRVRPAFLKGELTNLGSDKLMVADSRFGLRIGYAHLDNAHYLSVAPEIDLHFGDEVALGLGVPLHVRGFADGFYDTHQIKFREHDYDRPSDYARVLRFLTVGRKEDPFYLNVSQLSAATIGHGAIVRRYSGNIDTNVTRVGAQVDVYGTYGGFEAYTGDVVQPQRFLAGLAFVKPLGWLTGPSHETWGWTSLGISTAMDLSAPYTLQRAPNGFPAVGDSDVCPQPGVAECEPGEPMVKETRRAQVIGVDLETKIVKTEHADLKPYLDYSRLLGISNPTPAGARSSGGGGFTLGMLGRFNLGESTPHAFRLVVEGRYFDGNYLPGYFDTFYEVQRYQFITGKADTAYEPKLRTVLGRDPAHKRAGFYLEAAYQYNNGLALMAAYEDSFHVAGPADICGDCPPQLKAVGSRNLTLHIEYPAYSWLQFFASYYRRSFDGSSPGATLGDNTLIYGAARLHMLWVFFLNARIFRSWQADPVLGEMKNLWGGEVDLEIGWEFERSSRK